MTPRENSQLNRHDRVSGTHKGRPIAALGHQATQEVAELALLVRVGRDPPPGHPRVNQTLRENAGALPVALTAAAWSGSSSPGEVTYH
jgi:hypothetical protein